MIRRACALLFVILLALSSTGIGACQTYYSPPLPSIVGLSNGTLSNADAPLVIQFTSPVVAKTLKVKVVKYVTDIEGNLGDEDSDPNTNLDILYSFSDTDESGGVGDLAQDRKSLSIQFDATPPSGTSLAVLVEPGLSDDAGHVSRIRRRLIFSYKFDCGSAAATTAFPSGVYFFVVNVEQPIETQIQLWADIEVDTTTGNVVAEFTNADRNPDPNRCSPACSSTEACRLIPAEQCVIPSTKAGDDDEYPDWIANPNPPTGYAFSATGCVSEDNGVVRFANAPTDVTIQSPAVTVVGIELSASFQADPSGVFRGSGSLTASNVDPLNGAGSGTMTARLIPPDQVPMGLAPNPSQ
jgi:hypothetical protein